MFHGLSYTQYPLKKRNNWSKNNQLSIFVHKSLFLRFFLSGCFLHILYKTAWKSPSQRAFQCFSTDLSTGLLDKVLIIYKSMVYVWLLKALHEVLWLDGAKKLSFSACNEHACMHKSKYLYTCLKLAKINWVKHCIYSVSDNDKM